MSGLRRFSITKEQGELVSLALSILVEQFKDIQSRDGSPFWKIQEERATWLKQDIDNYQWHKRT